MRGPLRSHKSTMSGAEASLHDRKQPQDAPFSEGLAIETREGETQHFGAPLFQRGEHTLHELHGLHDAKKRVSNTDGP